MGQISRSPEKIAQSAHERKRFGLLQLNGSRSQQRRHASSQGKDGERIKRDGSKD